MAETDLGLLLAPMLAGLLVLSTHVPLGMEVLRRGIIFIDLAIAQVAALGVMLAHLLELQGADDAHGYQVQLTALTAAAAGALLLTWTEKRWPEIQEALIGLLFVFAASLGIVLLAGNPHGGEHLRDLLAGQILWVGLPQLLPVAGLYALILLLWLGLGRRLPRRAFYLLFALTVTVSVQLVGVFLVFASLIAPAVGARALPGQHRLGLPLAYVVGSLGYGLGLLASVFYDLPAGATIVCMLCVMACSCLFLTSLTKSKER